MKSKITPHGIVLKIVHEEKTYHGVLQNDFETNKTFGNCDLSVDTLILFDEEFNQLSFDGEDQEKTCQLYEIMERMIEENVITQ